MDEEIDLKKPIDNVPVAQATPVLASSAPAPVKTDYSRSNVLGRDQIVALKEQGFPFGLAQETGNTKATYPLRFWIIDNSGSMRTNDGHQIRGDAEHIRVVECNRWTELQGTVEYHIELAGLLMATTVFRMLNDPGVLVGPQEFSVAESDSPSVDEDVRKAKSIISKSEPRGVTPLTEHLHAIRERIHAVEHALRGNGQQAVIIIATDGLPSNNYGETTESVKTEFIAALRSLQSLPVWVVVRLCTDNDEVVEYYNNLDSILELPLEVIDDFFGEGQEIYAANKWLNYGLPLHRCREMGYHHRVFDLLDERLLNKDELRTFLQLLFGRTAMEDAPDPHADWKGFVDVVSRVVKAEGKQWNPNTKKLDYWIDVKQLEKAFGKRGFRLFGGRK